MKKVLFFLIITTMLWSCKRQSDMTPSNTKGEKPQTFSAGDGKWDVLGYGLDVTGDLLDISSVSDAPIFDMTKFERDYLNRINVITTTGGSEKYYSGATAVDYLKDVTTKKSFDVNGNATIEGADPAKNTLNFTGSLSKNSSDENKTTYSNRYSYATYEVVQRVKRIQFTGDVTLDLLMQYLTPEFVNNVANMSADNLVKRYGTHVMLDISIGGSLRFDYSGSIIVESDYLKKTSDVKVGLGFSLLKIIGVNLNANKSKEEITQITNSTVDKEYTARYYGGTNSGRSVSIDKDGNSSENINVGAWQQSVNANNAALIDVGKALFIYDFISNPVKKAQVKAAVEKHIADNQPIQVDAAPGSGLPADWVSRAKLLSIPMPPDAIHTSTSPILSSNGNNTLYSLNRAYRLVLQGDGNLVLYNSSGVGLWNSKTNNTATGWTYKLYFALDGNIILKKVASTGAEVDIWASYTNVRGGTAGTQNARRAYMSVQNDGNVALYYNGFDNGQYSLEYSTGTDNGKMSQRQGSFK